MAYNVKREESYEVYDSCYATVIGRSTHGAYLELDNGEPAFAYRFSALRNGTKVLCSILKKARGDRSALVGIDSVREYAA